MRLTLFILMLLSPIFGIGQETSSTDTICFTVDEAKILLSSTEKYYLCDSLVQTYDITIETLEEIIHSKDEQLLLTQHIIQQQAVKIKRLKWLSYGLGTTTIIVGILGILY